MGKKDKRVDAYISKSAPFAQPILNRLRKLVHEGCPDVEEGIKWGFPHFDYNGILCSMASFKQHCTFGFWKATLLSDRHDLLSRMGKTAMGNFGQLKSLTDLPSDKIMIEYVKEAAKLNEAGIKVPGRSKAAEKKPLKVPAYFKQALAKNKKSSKTFDGFNYSNKKEYVEWVSEAKTVETRNKRLATAIEWMAEGKVRNWKYIRK
jgi:uncharacterized protein YdeI (YjbR/CyaY-like superfamily)